ncbi:MAG: hypothetical protein Q9218_007521 [Villophora microphyllina]
MATPTPNGRGKRVIEETESSSDDVVEIPTLTIRNVKRPPRKRKLEQDSDSDQPRKRSKRAAAPANPALHKTEDGKSPRARAGSTELLTLAELSIPSGSGTLSSRKRQSLPQKGRFIGERAPQRQLKRTDRVI